MKKIMIPLCVLFIGISIGIIVKDILQTAYYKKVDSYEIIGKVKVIAQIINVRTQPTTTADKIYEVMRDEEFEIIEIFDEDDKYTWYKIVFSERRLGWVASLNEDPWIEEVK